MAYILPNPEKSINTMLKYDNELDIALYLTLDVFDLYALGLWMRGRS